MPENISGKVVAAISAGVVAAAGGVAHLAGAFTDDAGRAIKNVPRSRPLPPRDPVVPSPDPVTPRDPVPPPAPVATPTDDLIREGNNDGTAKDIICFAWDTYPIDETTGEFLLPSADEFAEAVVEALVPSGTSLSYRMKANSLHETINDPDTDAADVAVELGC